MGRAIIKIKDRYFEWSTVVDAPVTYAMTISEVVEHIKEKEGQRGLNYFDKSFPQLESVGANWRNMFITMEDTISGNKAGAYGITLTAEEIYERYSGER